MTGEQTKTEELEKRKWCYVLQPKDYGIAPCQKCGNTETQWSEFVDRLWCGKCQIDFVAEHWGVFDGPIGIEACKLMGIIFDRFEIGTDRIVEFNTNEWEKTWP